MEGVREFLESSTIHGLGYISTTRKLVRLFWVVVVIAGFTGAGIMIYQSFDNWAQSPVTTTIETLPTTKITFPNVTVCPPKNTYTDLNYDLMMTKNMTLKEDTRKELSNLASELLQDYVYKTIMDDMNKFNYYDPRFPSNYLYNNWYYGYTEISVPYKSFSFTDLNFKLNSFALAGSVSTKDFGREFNANEVDTMVDIEIDIVTPTGIATHGSVTLHIDIEKISLKDMSNNALDIERIQGEWHMHARLP